MAKLCNAQLHGCHAFFALIKAHERPYFMVRNLRQPDRSAVERNRKMNIKRSLNAWRTARRTYNELSSLSRRELDDLGIDRSDISNIARRAYRDAL